MGSALYNSQNGENNTPGKSSSASFHSTGLGKSERAWAILRSWASAKRAAEPMDTKIAPRPPAEPPSRNVLRSGGKACAGSAKTGPTNCKRQAVKSAKLG